MVVMEVRGAAMQIELCQNSSADALMERIKKEPLTLLMKDYACMEKFGRLDTGLPQNDEYFTAKPGDLILSEGNLLVVYYRPNTWHYTKLGRIVGLSEGTLKKVLGTGNITATFSMKEEIQMKQLQEKYTFFNGVRQSIWGDGVWQKSEVSGTFAMRKACQVGKDCGKGAL